MSRTRTGPGFTTSRSTSSMTEQRSIPREENSTAPLFRKRKSRVLGAPSGTGVFLRVPTHSHLPSLKGLGSSYNRLPSAETLGYLLSRLWRSRVWLDATLIREPAVSRRLSAPRQAQFWAGY